MIDDRYFFTRASLRIQMHTLQEDRIALESIIRYPIAVKAIVRYRVGVSARSVSVFVSEILGTPEATSREDASSERASVGL